MIYGPQLIFLIFLISDEFFFFFKVWWQDATLFVYFSYFITYIYSFNHMHTIHLSVAGASHHFLIACKLSGKNLPVPCGAKPRFELGPALQKADALPAKPLCTIS